MEDFSDNISSDSGVSYSSLALSIEEEFDVTTDYSSETNMTGQNYDIREIG